jgi:hypothetical protein
MLSCFIEIAQLADVLAALRGKTAAYEDQLRLGGPRAKHARASYMPGLRSNFAFTRSAHGMCTIPLSFVCFLFLFVIIR